MPAFLLPILAKLAGVGSAIRSGLAWLLKNPKALLAVAAGILVLLLVLQSCRLSSAKADLTTARAALVDPATKRKWADEAAERARDLATCRTNTDTLQAAITRQNASLAAAEAAGRTATAEAAAAVQRAQSAAAAADKAKAAISAPLKAPDACTRVQEVDARLLEELR